MLFNINNDSKYKDHSIAGTVIIENDIITGCPNPF